MNLDTLPRPSAKRIAVHVTPAAERALRAGHPWVFDQAIRSQSHEGQPGDLAVVFDAKRRFLAIGLYDPRSPIRVRVLQHREPANIDRAWFTARLRAAAEIRRPLTLTGTDGYRLVHGENDDLPGLVIDRYGGPRLPVVGIPSLRDGTAAMRNAMPLADVAKGEGVALTGTLVLKLYTAAWLPHLADILAGLESIQPAEHIVLRYSRNLEALMLPYGLADGDVLSGDPLSGPIVFQEYGLRFAADVAHGHKTGFFFDQRENRAQVHLLAAGRRVLDLFAYSGGFSVYAAAGGATSVTSVDISAPALEAAAANFALNRDTPGDQVEHTLVVADAFDALEGYKDSGQTFDMLIVDPPSFAKSATEIERALAAYARLARLATGLLTPGGILVMSSCSSRVSAGAFFDTVTQAAQQAGHPLAEILRTGHALDHPITFPEGAYLKCLFASMPG